MSKAVETVGKVVSPVMNLIGGDAPKAPRVEAPKAMPTPDDAAVTEARRRRIASERARSGRASTLLSGGGASRETLGG